MTFATVLLTVLSLSGENYAVEIPAGLVIAALTILVAVRFGILALIFSYFTNSLSRRSAHARPLAVACRGRAAPRRRDRCAGGARRSGSALGGKPAFAGSRLDEG